MDKLIIEGGKKLKGTIQVSGAKNSCLPILAATLLTDQRCRINNVPALRDINTMMELLSYLGAEVERDGRSVVVHAGNYRNITAPYEIVTRMRASVCVLGPLLAKNKKAKVSLPGGCIIGARPIDLHLKGLRELGAKIEIEGGYIIATAKKLKGKRIFLGGHFGSSVLATANTMMAATFAEGETVIENAACEPEVVDLADFLNKMGAKITGHSTPTIRIKGVRTLRGAEHTAIPDRIETATYMVAAAITDGEISLKGAKIEHLLAVIDKLRECGVEVKDTKTAVSVRRKSGSIKPVHVTTLPYPGFPTDMQAQMMSLLAISDGISVITEKIYPERFIHISELGRMGARIILEGPNAVIRGIERLKGAPVMASDLRASAGLVLAGLVAKGKTEIRRVYHLDRGYERLEEKLSGVGARIRREEE